METNKKRGKLEIIKKAVALYLKGLTDNQIAEALDRSPSLICNYRKTPEWEQEVIQQKEDQEIIKETVLEQSKDSINAYKSRLKIALEKIEEISHNQLETARIGQETCLAYAKELKERYDQEGMESIKDQAKSIRVMTELQRSTNDALRTAVENIRFTTQVDTVYHYFKEKEANETEITE